MQFRKSVLKAAKAKKPWQPFLVFPNHEVLQHLASLAVVLAAQSGRGPWKLVPRGAGFRQAAARIRRRLRPELDRAAIAALQGRREVYCLTFRWRGVAFALSARYREADRVTLIEIGLADRAWPDLPPPPKPQPPKPRRRQPVKGRKRP